MQMKKICNFRPFLLIAILMVISIIFAVFVFNDQIARFFLFIIILSLSIASLSCFIIFRNKILLVFMTSLLFMSLPIITIFAKSIAFNDNIKYENIEVSLLGKIDDYYRITNKGYLEIVLDEIEISEDKYIESVNGKIIIYTNPEYFDLTTLKVGTYLFVKTNITVNKLESKDVWQLSDLGENIFAVGFAKYYNIKILGNDFSVSSIVKSKVFELLKDSDMKNADVAYTMMFGDTNLLDKDIKNIYQSTGIAHLLAVSGLHISAIVFAISFILKKMKLNQTIQLIILVILLSFYSYLCNFSISVIRASLMAIIVNYSYIRGKAYDRLSVLAMLAVFIMTINPLEVFNLSFVLSFLAVLSIILLANPITRIFDKVFYNKFAKTIGTLFAIQVGLSTVNMFYFKTFQPLSFLANFISIPLATFAFIMIIISLLIFMIAPFMSFVCQWIGEIFKFISQLNNYIKDLNFEMVIGNISAILIPLTFLIMFILSDYCFLRKRTKLIASSSLFTIGLIIFLV